MDVGVLIVSYNVRELLRRSLRSLANSELHIVVVDNASQDGSADMVREDFPRVRLIALQENIGFAAAVNAAARACDTEHLLLLNPDTELQPATLSRMLKVMKLREADALSIGQVDATGFRQLALGWKPSFFSELMRRTVQRGLDARREGAATWLRRLYDKPGWVSWSSASCLLVKRSAFEAVAGFDEGYFLYFEDIDFCLRLGAAGYRIWHEPSLLVLHHRGRSASTSSQATRYYRESQQRFWRRHGGLVSSKLIPFYANARGALRLS